MRNGKTVRKQESPTAAERRGGKLNRDRVIAGALELIDEEGLDALSMRRLAERLGVQAMTLYSHVANKDEILDGLVVKVLGEVELPSPDVPWREAVRDAFSSYRRVLLRHPNVASAILHRPAQDAKAFLGVLDFSLGLLRRGGLDPKAALHAHRILTAFTTGLVMNDLAAPDPRGNAVLVWTQLVGEDRFPNVHEALPYMLDRNIDETFQLGIDIILEAQRTNG